MRFLASGKRAEKEVLQGFRYSATPGDLGGIASFGCFGSMIVGLRGAI